MTVKELRNNLRGKVKGIWKMNKAELIKAYNKISATPETKVEKALEGRTILKATNEENWLEIREGGIGGSDISSIIGLNKYSSRIDTFIAKASRNNARLRQEYEEKQRKIKESEAVKMGHILEPVVAGLFQSKNNYYKVVDYPVTVKANPWEIANVDRYIVDKKGKVGVLEIKTTSQYNKDEWSGETVPDSYFCQVQWYLAVTGLDYGYIACLIGGQTYRQFRIERDENTIEYLRREALYFWEDHVIVNEIPQPDGSSSYTEHLKFKAKYFEDKGEKIEIETAVDKIEEYDRLQDDKKEIDKKIECIKQEVFNEVLERGSKKGTWGEKKVSLLGGKGNSFNSRAFKKDHPELYSSYVEVKEKAHYIKIS